MCVLKLSPGAVSGALSHSSLGVFFFFLKCVFVTSQSNVRGVSHYAEAPYVDQSQQFQQRSTVVQYHLKKPRNQHVSQNAAHLCNEVYFFLCIVLYLLCIFLFCIIYLFNIIIITSIIMIIFIVFGQGFRDHLQFAILKTKSKVFTFCIFFIHCRVRKLMLHIC